MRKTKFRQKVKDNYGGGWDYAELTNTGNLHWKFAIQSYEKGTVGQFTGLKDKNGKEIYEGDIFSDGSQCQYMLSGYKKIWENGDFEDLDLKENIDEVIGNIY